MLRGANTAQAAVVLQRIGDRLRNIRLDGASRPINITLSIGLASTEDDESYESAVVHHVAYLRLYAAKKWGRDRIVAAGAHPAAASGTGASVRRRVTANTMDSSVLRSRRADFTRTGQDPDRRRKSA